MRLAAGLEGVNVVIRVPESEAESQEGQGRLVARHQIEGWQLWEIPAFGIDILTPHEVQEARGLSDVLREGIALETDRLAIAVGSSFLQSVRWRTGQFRLLDAVSVLDTTFEVEFYVDKERVPASVAHVPLTLESNIDRSLSMNVHSVIERDLRGNTRPPLIDVLLLDARLFQSEGEHRVALAFAAIVLELALIETLRIRLRRANAGTNREIDKFLDEISNRLLSTIILSLLNIGDPSYRERCKTVFEWRNALIHGKRRRVSRDEAQIAIEAAQKMADILREEPKRARVM